MSIIDDEIGKLYQEYAMGEHIDKLESDIKALRADNARLRQQLKSLVEAWNRYQKAGMADKVMATMKLRDAFLAVQSAQETEEK